MMTSLSSLGSRLSGSVRDLKAYDERRASFPGEHWMVMGLGIAVLLGSQRSRSPLARALGSAAGSALLYRAASGRDGVTRLLGYLPAGRKLLGR